MGLKPVYFDLDQSLIRPVSTTTLVQVVAYMKKFPDINVQVRSHTDAKASADYNLKLSQKRGESTVNYLIDNGIEASHLSGEGLGETELTNDCTKRESCPDEKHQ